MLKVIKCHLHTTTLYTLYYPMKYYDWVCYILRRITSILLLTCNITMQNNIVKILIIML